MADPTNSQIAAAFDELGDLYELDGAIIHRVVAYRTAAKVVREASVSVAALTREGKVTSLPGIGKTLEEKIVALMDEGDIPSSVKLRAKFPVGLIEMTRLPGLGPSGARKLFEELGIDSIDALEKAARGEKLRSLKGSARRPEENLLAAIEALDGEAPQPRMLLSQALRVAEPILDALRAHPAPTGWSWPARRGAGPTRLRTSTSSPRRTTRWGSRRR